MRKVHTNAGLVRKGPKQPGAGAKLQPITQIGVITIAVQINARTKTERQ